LIGALPEVAPTSGIGGVPTKGSPRNLHHIEVDNQTAAAKNVYRISDAAISLLDFPSKGRPGKIEGTREWVVGDSPYILVYRIANDSIRIVRVMHGAQRWPKVMPQL
jgi:plasmid stabilization system protein ParE